MIPFRQAAILAAILATIALAVSLERVGARPAPWLDNLARSCAKYELRGLAATLWLAAGRSYDEAVGRSVRGNASASRAASEAGADAYAQAARVYAEAGSAAAAGAAFSSALRAAPWRQDLRTELILAQRAGGDPTAQQHLADLAYRYDCPQAQRALAAEALAHGQTADAVSILSHAAARAPRDYEVNAALARALLQAGKQQDAAQAAQAAAALAPAQRALATRDLLTETGAPAPSWLAAWWGDVVSPHALTLGGLLVYLLCVFSPALRRRVRR